MTQLGAHAVLSLRPPARVPRVGVATIALAALVLVATPAHSYHVIGSWGGHRFSALGGAFDGAGDFDGDGFDDVLVGIPYDGFGNSDGVVYVAFGSATGLRRQVVLIGRPAQGLGSVAVRAGDVDGDGYGDVIVGDRNTLYVYRGSQVPDTTADLDLQIAPGVVRSVGDWNADGFDDIVVAAPQSGRITVFFGGDPMDAIPDRAWTGEVGMGTAVAGGRDLNGDGIDDLVVGSPNADPSGLTDAGEVRVYFGGVDPDTLVDFVLPGAIAGGGFGTSLALLGDFDGDGSSDVLAGAPSVPAGRVYVFRGGPALDSSADWSVGGTALAGTLGRSVAAGDDVNRDQRSDVIVGGFSSDQWAIYFGGASADTMADVVYPGGGIYPSGGSVAQAGDVDGDGYQDWIGGRNGGFGMGNHTSVLVFALHGVTPLTLPEFVEGVPAAVRWDGDDRVDLWFTPDDQNWQKLAGGIGGDLTNVTTVVLPATTIGRLRWSLADVDSMDFHSPLFTVHDSLEVTCTSAVPLGAGIGITWAAVWYGYPSVPQLYRLYRQNVGGETRVGPDTLTASGFTDPAGTASAHYRLVALPPDATERNLATIAVGTGSCDSVRVTQPVAGTSWNIPGMGPSDGQIWWSATRPVDVWVSFDGGIDWKLAAANQAPVGEVTVMALIPIQPTEHADARVSIHDAPWVDDEVDGEFRITGLTATNFTAVAQSAGGVTLSWGLSAGPGPETYEHVSVSRVDPGGSQVPLGGAYPWIGFSAFDADGVVGSQYQLGVSRYPFQALLATAVAGNGPTKLVVAPLPASRNDLITVAIPEIRGSLGQPVTDVEVRVYDVSGREVARIAEHRSGQSGSLQWTPAAYGLRTGLYWMRLKSEQAGYSENRRVVVLD